MYLYRTERPGSAVFLHFCLELDVVVLLLELGRGHFISFLSQKHFRPQPCKQKGPNRNLILRGSGL